MPGLSVAAPSVATSTSYGSYRTRYQPAKCIHIGNVTVYVEDELPMHVRLCKVAAFRQETPLETRTLLSKRDLCSLSVVTC